MPKRQQSNYQHKEPNQLLFYLTATHTTNMETTVPLALQQELNRVTAQILANAKGRNQEVIKVYNSIVYEIKLMLAHIPNKRKRQCLQTVYPSVRGDDQVVKEFICLYCSVTLSLYKDKFIIEYHTDDYFTENRIGSHTYNALVRVAFKHTMQQNTKHYLESALFINMHKLNQMDYFLQRQAEEDSIVCIKEYYDALEEQKRNKCSTACTSNV